MGYFDKFDAQETKLENILDKECLLHKFKTDTFPMTLTITQNQSPDAQMEIYSQDSDDVSSQDAKLVLTFRIGGVSHRFYNRFIISDELFTKIKNHGKKMRDLWLQADHAARMEQKEQYGPGSDEAEDEDEADPFEDFEEDDSENESDDAGE